MDAAVLLMQGPACIACNPATARMFGLARHEDMLGKTVLDFALPKQPDGTDSVVLVQRYVEKALREGTQAFEWHAVRADGERLVMEVRFTPFQSGDDLLFQCVAVDITPRKQAEEALAAEKERLAVTLRSIGEGVITTDTAGTIVLMNGAAEGLTGWRQDEAVGRPLREVFRIVDGRTGEPREDPAAKVLATGQGVGPAGSTFLVARDGSRRAVADSGAPIRDRDSTVIGVVLTFRDVTDHNRLEEELRKVQKLESLGLLAGGIAHDFNNLLTGILGSVSLAQLHADTGSQQAAWLLEAEKAIERARTLTQQLLTFSKGGAPVRKTARIDELILDSASFALRGSNVGCEFSIPDDLWPVDIDEGQISQVISNLVVNADEAMPEGGTVRVGARNLAPGEPRPSELPDGRCVEISVTDQGIGVPTEYLERIFDPYFTTKKKGSGLGLTTCYAIVRKHGGTITVESRPGRGSTFRICLEASGRSSPPAQAREEAEPGHGRILVMDDEEVIRNVCRHMLTHLGYEVVTAGDGAEAVCRYTDAWASRRPFDAVIMDLTVPGGLGGKDATDRIRKLDPAAKVIVSSGYSNDPIMSDFRAHGFDGVIVKPYEIRLLSRQLREVLVGRADPGQ